jgi:hypothetical protein
MPVDGTWNLTISSPVGTQGGTLRLVVRDHDLTGEIDGRDGQLSILGGEVIGSDLFWMVDTATGAVEFSASVVGETMTGEIHVDDFGDITFVGSYAGPAPDA